MPMEDCIMNIKVVANAPRCQVPSSQLCIRCGGTSHTALYTITFDCYRVWQHTSLCMQSSTYYIAYVMHYRACIRGSQKPPTLTSPIVMLMHAQQVTLLQSTTGLETNYIHCTTLQSAC